MSQCVFNENGQSAGRRRHCSLYYPATAPRPWTPPAAKNQDQPGRPAHASQCQCTNTGCRRGNRRTSQVGALCPFATPCGCPFCRTCIRRPRCLHLAKIQRHRICHKRMPSLCCSLCRARPLRPALKLAGTPAGSTR